MKSCLILLVVYMLMASYVAKEQRNLGFFSSFIGTIIARTIIRKLEKKQNKLIAVGNDDVQVS